MAVLACALPGWLALHLGVLEHITWGLSLSFTYSHLLFGDRDLLIQGTNMHEF